MKIAKKTAKKIITLVLALALIFMLCVPGFAFSTSAKYTQVKLANAPTVTGTFTVYLDIIGYSRDGDNIARYKLPVSMGASGVTDTYFVIDVLLAAQSQYNWLTFYTGSYTVITGTSTAITGVKDTDVSNTLFGLLPIVGRYGWMFRIDNKFPCLNSADWPSGWTSSDGPLGATIEQAYVTANKTISLYFADAGESSAPTKFTGIGAADYDATHHTLEIDLYASNSYYADLTNYWYIKSFAIIPDNTLVSVKVNGTTYSGYTNDGTLTITDSALPIVTGTNEIELLPIETTYINGGVTYGVALYTGSYFSWTE